MKSKILLFVVFIGLECLILLIYYPKKQQEIVQLEQDIQEVTLEIQDLVYQSNQLDVLDAQIALLENKNEKKEAREQLLDLFKKIETSSFQEVQYKKLKDEIENYTVLKNRYIFSAVGHYNSVMELLDYIKQQGDAIEIKSLYLDSSIQTDLTYLTIYGDKLKNVYAINLEWIVDYG